MINFKYNIHGGSLTSIIVDNEERLYQIDERAWKGQDVVIFPFVARLKDKSYTVNNKTYSMLNHGLARYNDFTIIYEDDNKTILSFSSNEETLLQYPYKFELQVIYQKDDKTNTLKVTYKVINKDNKNIYFGIGGHPAMKVSYDEVNDIEGNYLDFGKELDLEYYAMDKDYQFIDTKKKYQKTRYIHLSKKYFKEWNTVILDARDIDEITLVRKDNKKVVYNVKDARFVAIWSHQEYGDYVCVEPWYSLPDYVDADSELSKKKTLVELEANKEFEFSYSVSFK